MAIQHGRTPLDVFAEPLKVQLETFLDEHRAALHACLDGLTEEQARRSLVPSPTTLLGLLKHAIYAEKVWFDEAITGRSRQELGLPPRAGDAFILTREDTTGSPPARLSEGGGRPPGARPGLGWDTGPRGPGGGRCPCDGFICTS